MAERWERTTKRLGRDDRESGETIAGFARTHSSEAFFGCDTMLEAGVFSALVEIQRKQGEDKQHVDP